MAVLGSYALLQHKKTIRLHFLPRGRAIPLPLKPSLSTTFDKLARNIWEVQELEAADQKASAELGWIVPFEDNVKVVVSQRELFYWLLQVNSLQQRLTNTGMRRVKSPLSQRSHPTVGRRRLRAYKHLLLSASVVEFVNTNVLHIKEEYTGQIDSPYTLEKLWNLIQEIESIVPVVEI